MNSHFYRYIVAVAENGTIIKASNELYVSPPAISKAIQKTEAELGVTLFNRSGNKLIPTFAGDVFIKRAKNLLYMEDQMANELANVKMLETGHLNIGVQMGIVSHAMAAIQAFHRAYPKVSLRIFEDTHIKLIEKLENQQIDVMLSRVNVVEESICPQILSSDVYILAVPRHHPLLDHAMKKAGHVFPWINFELCKKEPFICALPDQNMHLLLNQICRQYQFSPHIEVEATSLKTCLSFVSSGQGIALSYLSNATAPYNHGELSLLSFGQTPIVSHLILSHNQHTYCKEIVATFSQVCRNHFRTHPIIPES